MEYGITRIDGKTYMILEQGRLSHRLFEAVTARSGLIIDALDMARQETLQLDRQPTTPILEHNFHLGTNPAGKNMRATVEVYDDHILLKSMTEVEE